jgi:hypothetical protein
VAITNPHLITIPIPAHPWMVFAKSVIPYATILICTFALYLKSPQTNKAEPVFPPNP